MAWVTIFLATFLAGVGLNALEITFIVREKKIKEPFNMSILSLAIADLFSSITMVILGIIYIVKSKYLEGLLKIVFPSLISSQFHIIYITVLRLIAVMWPMKLKILITPLRSTVSLIVIWILSIAFTIVHKQFEIWSGTIMLGCVLLICGVSIIISYGLIVYTLIKQRMKITPTTSSRQNLRTVAYSLALTIAFIVCNYPWAFILFTQDNYDPSQIPLNTETFLLWLTLIIDPIIYFLFNSLKNSNVCHSCMH